MTFVKNKSYPTNWSTIAEVFGQLQYRQIGKMNFANNVSPVAANKIHITQSTCKALESTGKFIMKKRGTISAMVRNL